MEYTFKITEQEAGVIFRGLGKLLGEEMFVVACKLVAQKAEQDRPQDKTTAETATDDKG